MPSKNPVREMQGRVNEAFGSFETHEQIFETGLSIIVPVYNEAPAIPFFLKSILPLVREIETQIRSKLSPKGIVTKNAVCEIIFIDDGSKDNTANIIQEACKSHENIKLIRFSRNFGKEAALTAGIDHATGAALVPIDVDLQDPPELILDMIDKWAEGYDVVNARRLDRSSDTRMKKLSAHLFYRLFNKISETAIEYNVGDFRLMTYKVIAVLRSLKEKNRFMKGLFAWAGFNQTTIDYVRAKRAAGQTSFNYWKLWNFALDGIVSFSSAPLRVWSYIGVLISVICFLSTLVMLIANIWLINPFETSTILLTLLMMIGGCNLIAMGVFGEYLGRIFSETRDRPIYIIQSKTNFMHKTEGKNGHDSISEHGPSRTNTLVV